ACTRQTGDALSGSQSHRFQLRKDRPLTVQNERAKTKKPAAVAGAGFCRVSDTTMGEEGYFRDVTMSTKNCRIHPRGSCAHQGRNTLTMNTCDFRQPQVIATVDIVLPCKPAHLTIARYQLRHEFIHSAGQRVT